MIFHCQTVRKDLAHAVTRYLEPATKHKQAQKIKTDSHAMGLLKGLSRAKENALGLEANNHRV